MDRGFPEIIGDALSLAQRFGSELTRLRVARGYSLRTLARMVGMTAHSALVDYERGQRLPPADLLAALVTALRPDTARLTELHNAATGGSATAAGTVGSAATCARCAQVVELAVDILDQVAQLVRELRDQRLHEMSSISHRTDLAQPSPVPDHTGPLTVKQPSGGVVLNMF